MQHENFQEEEMNNSLKRYNKRLVEEKEKEDKKQATIRRLNSDERMKEYFSKFNASSVQSFIEDYAAHIETINQYGGMYEDMYEKQTTKYLEQAEWCLAQLQFKKLFDLRKIWGANLLKLDGIECTSDFLKWGHDIMNCTLIPPITEEEFEHYFEFANTEEFVIPEYKLHWLELENAVDGDDEDWPRWFSYMPSYINDQLLSTLPDERKKKEREYAKVADKVRMDEIEAKYETGELVKKVADSRPFLFAHSYSGVLDFMKQFEDVEMVRKFEKMCEHGNLLDMQEEVEGEQNSTWIDQQVESLIITLNTMRDFKLPIEANADWRVGLLKAWEKYERQETINSLLVAYDQYTFRLQNKIAMPVYDPENTFQQTMESLKRQVLQGRKLLGEPEDFNF